MSCRICLNKNAIDVFETGRVAICRSCITLLNETSVTPRQAKKILEEYLKKRLSQWDNAKIKKPDDYEPWQVKSARQRHEDSLIFDSHFWANQQAWINDLVAGKYSKWLSSEELIAIKIERACRRKLLRRDPPRKVDYPKNWPIRAARVRLRDRSECRLCGKTWEPEIIDLHVHHIIHKSNSGSHNQNNLVTLCHLHHNEEHPEQIFTAQPREHERLYPLSTLIDASENRPPATQTRKKSNHDTPTWINRPFPNQEEQKQDGAPLSEVARHRNKNTFTSCADVIENEIISDIVKQPNVPTKNYLPPPPSLQASFKQHIDTCCPQCFTAVIAVTNNPIKQKIRCPQCHSIFIYSTRDEDIQKNVRLRKFKKNLIDLLFTIIIIMILSLLFIS